MLVDLFRRLCGRATPPAVRATVEPMLPWEPAPEPIPAPIGLREPLVQSVPRPKPARPESASRHRAHRQAEPAPVSTPTPRRRRRRSEPGELSATMHAKRLLHWCQTDGGVTGAILARDLADSYRQMCAWDCLEPYAWQTLAKALKPLTGGQKTYRWMGPPNRSPRLRYYHIPPLPPGSDTTFLELGAWLARETVPVRLRRAA